MHLMQLPSCRPETLGHLYRRLFEANIIRYKCWGFCYTSFCQLNSWKPVALSTCSIALLRGCAWIVYLGSFYIRVHPLYPSEIYCFGTSEAWEVAERGGTCRESSWCLGREIPSFNLAEWKRCPTLHVLVWNCLVQEAKITLKKRYKIWDSQASGWWESPMFPRKIREEVSADLWALGISNQPASKKLKLVNQMRSGNP